MANTTWLIVFVLFAIAASHQMNLKETHPDYYEKVQKFTDECIRESHADKDDVTDLYEKGEFPNKEELKCFVHCIFEKTEIMDEDGELLESGIKAIVREDADSDKVDEMIEKCIKIKTDNPCETAYKFSQCCNDFD